jgi:NADPH:quinone reductase-like Zn-dependent oxidoreductase
VVGADVKQFSIGDDVVGMVALNQMSGGCAEFVTLPSINVGN